MIENFVRYEDIDYTKLDKILDTLKFVKATGKKTKVAYANVACSFDTETTSTEVDGKKVAFTYAWQFALTDKFYCYGRTWQDFRTLVNYISSHLSLNSNHALICYVHNFAFEFQFMRKYFKWTEVFSTKERNPIKAMLEQGIEFRDSYILSGMTLEKTAENLTSHKVKKLVGDLDYSLVRTPATPLTDKELGYMKNDVVILVYYIEEQIEMYGNIAEVPLTNTGRVRRKIKKRAFDQKETKNYWITRKQMKYLTLTPELYLKLKQAFAGGFAHANANHVGKIFRNVQSMDFTSSYPTVILSSDRFPMSMPFKYRFVSNSQFIHDLRNKYKMYFFTATFKELTSKIDFENYLSASKCFNTEGVQENNGRVWMADKLSVTICSVDWEIIEQCYEWEDVEFSDITEYNTNYLPKYMLETAIELYKLKTTLKDVKGKEAEYQVSKGMLNSLYGMTVTDIAKPEIAYGKKWGEVTPNLKEAIDSYNKSYRFLYYPWGVVVAALARQNLWSGILELGNDYIYSDTDSVKFINAEKHMGYFKWYNWQITEQLKKMCKKKGFNYDDLAPKTIDGEIKPLGVWDADHFYQYFKTLGAKRYISIEDGELETTVSGLGKEEGAKYLLKISDNDPIKAIENFKIGLIVPASETGKNTHTYIDEPFKGKITDYLGVTHEVESLSSVHLEPTSFEMTIPPTFAEFLADVVIGKEHKINEVFHG